MSVIQEETEVLKDELESVYFQLREQPPRMKKELKQINKEVYRLMKQLDKLLRANHKLEVCGKEKMKSCAGKKRIGIIIIFSIQNGYNLQGVPELRAHLKTPYLLNYEWQKNKSCAILITLIFL